MDVEKVFHMKEGAGDTSYAKNSFLQKKAWATVSNIVVETLEDLCLAVAPESLGIADLGCSSGPNTLSTVKEMVAAVVGSRRKMRRVAAPPGEIRVYLNDLPANDFNSIFAALPEFRRELAASENVFIAACAGSFYGRLFPARSLHFVHSAHSLHWISQVPPAIYDDEGKSTNKGSIYISESSPPEVSLAYLTQFQADFSLFLRSRSDELVNDGRMVLILMGRVGSSHIDRGNYVLWKLLTRSFSILVSQGEMEEEKFDSYEVPFYAPCKEEIEKEVRKDGCFDIDLLDTFEIEKVDDGNLSYGRAVARAVRAIQEPIIYHHFGEGINLDYLFETYGRLIDEELAIDDIRPVSFVLVLRKK